MLKPERPADKASRKRQGGVLGASPLEIKRHPLVFRRLSYMCTSQHGRDQRKGPPVPVIGQWLMNGQCRRPGLGVDIPAR